VLIKRARIQNFRCLKDVEIVFDTVTTFIGPNGVGKSTVLRALDWFFNGGVLTDEDVLYGADQRWIRVEVELDHLTAADREALTGRYAPGSRDSIMAWRTWADGQETMKIQAYAFPQFEEIRASAAGAVAKRARYNKLCLDHPDLELVSPDASSWLACEAAMAGWEREHPEYLKDVGGSETYLIDSELFTYVLVTADLRAGEETQDSRTALLGQLLERSIDRTEADAELQELASGYLKRQAEIHAAHYTPRLDELSAALSREVASFTQGRSVKVSTVNADPKPQRVQFSLSIRDGQTDTRVDRQGHGFQRALLIAVLKALANHGAQAGQPGVICLAIEEPELFQHPVQARAFASVLRKLAQDTLQQMQVTYATHSPFFIEASHFPQVRRVSRRFTNAESSPVVTVAHVTEDQVVDHLSDFVPAESVRRRTAALCIDTLPEAMFAEAVILVEGSTDQAVLEGCAERADDFLSSHGIEVVEVNGKGGILLPYAILKLLGIPCYLIFDGDRGCADRMRANQKTETQITAAEAAIRKDNRRILRYFDVVEEDWPATGVHKSYAVFEDCVETELTASWPAWQARVDELVTAGTGFLGKNRATYRYAAATAAGEAPGLLQEMLAAARATRGTGE
jgi:hypothetical protein